MSDSNDNNNNPNNKPTPSSLNGIPELNNYCQLSHYHQELQTQRQKFLLANSNINKNNHNPDPIFSNSSPISLLSPLDNMLSPRDQPVNKITPNSEVTEISTNTSMRNTSFFNNGKLSFERPASILLPPIISMAKKSSIGQSIATNPVSKSATVETNSSSKPQSKRKYSRNGCTQCKKRRMKCDESKPSCWQCSRMKRECIYILNPKNKKRKQKQSSADINKDAKKTKDKTVKKHALEQQPVIKDQQNLPDVITTHDLDSYDVNLLLQNLNDIVNMKLNDSTIDDPMMSLENFDVPVFDLMGGDTVTMNSSSLSSVTSPNNNFINANLNTISKGANPSHPVIPISFLVDNPITFNTKLESFKLGATHDKYLKVFYYDCMDSIAPFFQDQSNPLRDTVLSFAKNESYLLSAILAVGASITFKKTQDIEDEKSYCAYLTHCLNLLSEQFKNESNVVNKLEPIILTVIMLAWDCIYTMNSQWRSHLQGVTELFKKINTKCSSKVLNLAKCWFKVMETFASISTVLGGALVDELDLDVIFDPYNYQYLDSLKFLNVITPLNEFNLIRGHKEDFDLVIKEVIKALNIIRHSEKNHFSENGIFTKDLDYLLWSPAKNGSSSLVSKFSYFKIQKILVEIDKQLEYEFIDKSGIIPDDNPSHPKNSGIQDNAIDLVKLKSGEEIAISWYDISHQTQVLSFLLIVLLKLLGIPKESIIIQEVVRKITGFFKFLDSDAPPQNSRTCYSNFAILVAGLNAVDEKTRDIIKQYYELNGKKFQRLTKHNLNRLEKVWYGKNESSKYNLEDQDVLTW
ncbi:related to Lysine biosynthesis regulatory protein LYS14 [Saccharomycodes ludwigii]|uniref:Related to Lysine biosynthesis regulatory protein LYS14 n=1 Tax=Saccharomycodes ludwigii TaxID=36035 RepID=A0A376B4G7_9ASCO|nr:hypothetical protein SCDLUD_003687 [Saccharomycodes ludwigii]KAH3900688.1 hypothetical protein SCDLUD_003687 [Saccharomycodes ludwigii]SSD59563.1 related to Lysine biosynthesis regulatory protein LYS14 [Saccharomycodes ludwigii]